MKFTFIICSVIVNELIGKSSELNNCDPKFSGRINNITVPVGRDATLTCVVHNLLPFKVAWMHIDTQTILSIQNHVITKNQRIGISHTEHRIWQLRIRHIQESDRGWYMCQINTDPMQSEIGYLHVVIPPDIIDYQTSADMVVQDGQNVTLTCSATGLPIPTIMWRREKEIPIDIIDGRNVYTIVGANLTIFQVTRAHMGSYLCVASNGIPPTVSKRITIVVNFAPTIWTRSDVIYVSFGQKVTLECITEANPASVNFWVKNKEFIQGGTYDMIAQNNAYKIIMRLTVRLLKAKNYGEYKCVAKNMIGESERTIHIHHKANKNVHLSNQTSYLDNQLLIEEYSYNSGTKHLTIYWTGTYILYIFTFLKANQLKF